MPLTDRERRMLFILRDIVEWQNIDHEDNCPEDDTCVCELVAQVNEAIREAEAAQEGEGR